MAVVERSPPFGSAWCRYWSEEVRCGGTGLHDWPRRMSPMFESVVCLNDAFARQFRLRVLFGFDEFEFSLTVPILFFSIENFIKKFIFHVY